MTGPFCLGGERRKIAEESQKTSIQDLNAVFKFIGQGHCGQMEGLAQRRENECDPAQNSVQVQ